jgi:tRNA1(Val) A37 N6-methylase TrmN6
MKETQFLGGKVQLAQSETGHRAGTDAILLAATVSESFAGLVVDAGSASGAAGLCVAARAKDANLYFIEIDPSEADLARANILANRWQSRARVVEADLLADFKAREAMGLTKADADLVITNPPYLAEGKTRPSPDSHRQRAHTMPEGGLERWLVACHAMLKPHGALSLIHRADALPEILEALEGRFGGVSILPVYPHQGAPATRILIAAIKGSRAPLTLLTGLVLHEPDGGFTPRVEAIHRGDEGLYLKD